MWCRILLFSVSVYLFASCTHHRLLTEQHNQYDVELTIRAANNVVFDTINIIVSFENRSTNDIYLLGTKQIAFSSYPDSEWKLYLLFRDSIPMFYPIPLRDLVEDKLIAGNKEEYIFLKSGEMYTFNFDIVLSELGAAECTLYRLRNLNSGYGEYSLKLTYRDHSFDHLGPLYPLKYRGCKKAFRGTVESNKIQILNCEN